MSRPLSSRATPGRVIALAAVATLVLAGLASLVKLGQSSRIPLATNGTGIGAVIATLPKAGDELCLPEAVVPKGTGAIELWLGYHDAANPATLTGTLKLLGVAAPVAVQATQVPLGGTYRELPLAGVVDREVRGQLCVTRSGAGGQVDVGGATVTQPIGVTNSGATVNGAAIGAVEPSLHFMAAPGKTTTGWSRIPGAIHHLAALSPSGLPPLLLGLVVIGLTGGSLFLLLWNLATAPRRSARRVGLLCVVASLGLTVTWATATPIFQGPDESEHFAYAQHLAETGERAAPGRGSPLPPYSTQEQAVYSLLHHNAVVIERQARNPWTDTTRRDINATDRLPGDDGGGFTESASGHSAFYYALLAPSIKLAGKSLTAQLYAARLTTAVMAALIAGLAAWAAALLVPGRRRVAALGGLAAATLPIAASVGGTVNNDVLVNLAAAAGFVGVVALLVSPRGALWRYGVVGALIAVMPVAKVTGIGLGIAFLGALVFAAVQRRQLAAIAGALVAAGAGVAAALVVMTLGSELFVDGQTLTLFNVHPVDASVVGPAVPFIYKLDYILQLFVPFIHLKLDLYPDKVPLYRIYILGTWGGFGWNRLYLPTSLNEALGYATGLGVILGFVALLRQRAWVARHRLATLAVALTPLIAIIFVAYAYGYLGPRPVQPEQGRYIVIALAPLALWFAAVPAIFKPGHLRSATTGVIAGGLSAMAIVGLLVATSGWAA